MEEETEYLKLPIEDRCAHKLWKARVNGYEALAKQCLQLAPDEKSPEWNKYTHLMKKIVVDSNAVAQEKGLESVLAFVENAAVASKTVSDVMAGLVTKCLAAPKPKTKETALNILLMYVEIEKCEAVQEELMKGLSQKNPKVVASCIHSLTMMMREFGHKVLNVKPLLKQIPVLLEDRDKNVREEGKQLCIEICRWIPSIQSTVTSPLKQVQVSELEAELKKFGNEKPVPTRYIRSEQEKMRKKAEQEIEEADGEEEDGAEDGEEEVDAVDLLEPVNILSKLDKEFWEKSEATKWQDRKEAMETLLQLTKNPKLEQGDYFEVVKLLKKIISKDKNVMIVALASQCLGGIARGLRKRFQPYAAGCIPVLLEKFREKKANVVSALQEAIDAVFLATTLEAIQEDVLAALENKNPSVKAETAAFLARSFKHCTPILLTKKLLKGYVAPLLKTLNSSDPIVRDNSAEALGVALKVVGEKNMMPLLADVDKLKQTKIKENADKAELIAKQPGAKAKVVKPAPAPAAHAPSNPPASKAAAAPSKPATVRKVSKPAGGGARKEKVVKGGSSQSPAPEPEEKEISSEEVEDLLANILPEDAVKGLSSANWKTRKEAMEAIQKIIDSSASDLPCQAVVLLLLKKPGLKDNNFQILKLKLEALVTLSGRGKFSRTSALHCLKDVCDKLGDPKVGDTAREVLSCVAEATRLDWVAPEVLANAFAHKSPKVQSEALNWLAQAILEFGFVLQVKSLKEYLKKALAATNPTIRTAGVNLLGTLYMYVGPKIRILFEDEKSSVLSIIDAEFQKRDGESPPAPTRGLSPVETSEGSGGDKSKPAQQQAAAVDMDDLVERTDISPQITQQLLTELNDKNWKDRNEGLQKLATIIDSAKVITGALGELPLVLKARLCDSNKNLAAQSLSICQSLGAAMGPHCKQHVRTLIPGVLQNMADNKNTIRSAALSCLNTWVEQLSFRDMWEGEMFADALKTENPYLRADLLVWLAEHMQKADNLPKDDVVACVPYVLSSLEDRSPDVRKGAQGALLPFMIHLSYDSMARQAHKLKPALQKGVMEQLEKVRPLLPAKPAAPAKANTKKATAVVQPLGKSNNESQPPGIRTKANKPAATKSRLMAPSASKTSKKKEEEMDSSPLLHQNNLKNQRVSDEQKLKVLKWNFTTPREEFIEQLRDQMTNAHVNSLLIMQMFHSDFKMHLKVIDALQEDLDGNWDALVCNLDLILKWLTLRFFDTNPSVVLRGLEYLNTVFNRLASSQYRLVECEAQAFIPYLVTKLGDPKDAVRNPVKSIIRELCRVHPASKMFTHLMEGLKSKNARQRTECLEELGNLISSYGTAVCQPSPSAAMKDIAKQIADRDNSVRNAAINAVLKAYYIEGDKVYKLIGQLAPKDFSLLEERIKRAGKVRPAPVQPPQQVQQQSRLPAARNSRQNQRDVEEEQPQANNRLRRSAVPVTPVPRPQSGAFYLELDKLEQFDSDCGGDRSDEGSSLKSKLVEYDADDILNGNPISIPKVSSYKGSPVSQSVNSNLSAARDSNEAIDIVLGQLSAKSIMPCLSAVASLLEVINSHDHSSALIPRVDQIVRMCTVQYQMNQKRLNEPDSDQEDVTRIYRNVTKLLTDLLNKEELAKVINTDDLKDLVDVLLKTLLEPEILELPDASMVMRSLNMITMRLIEKTDLTIVFCALVSLLTEGVNKENIDPSQSKYVELIMKCLWKATKYIPDHRNIHTSEVILSCHVFIKAFPESSWKCRSDVPFKTIKTILHSLVKLMGPDILNHTHQISPDSQTLYFINKFLKNQEKGSLESSRKSSTSEKKRLPKRAHDSLTEIFRAIGDKERSKLGLEQLYDFKLQYPEADIQPFLVRSSQYFQNYIDRGLQKIQVEREGGVGGGGHIRPSTYSASKEETANNNNNTANVFLDKLKTLRELGDLEKNSGSTNANTEKRPPTTQALSHRVENKLSSGSSLQDLTRRTNRVSELDENTKTSSSSLEDLRKRLQRIRDQPN